MHAIRSEAKRTAWRGDDNSTTRWIPYANRHGSGSHKRTPSASSRDIEKDGGTLTETPSSSTPRPFRLDSGDSVRSRQANPNSPTAITEEPSPIENDPASANSTLTNNDALPNGDLRKRHTTLEPSGSGNDDEKEATISKNTTASSKKKGSIWRNGNHIPVPQQLKAILWTWPNLLLVCVPIGIALNYVNVNELAVFVVNFLAIIPLAAILSMATEEIALRVGPTIGGLLNASFGNATELIVAIIALAKDEIIIVQTSLIGSMLSNLLLVMGMCFFFGGYNRMEQYFNVVVAQTASSLLTLAVGSLIIPTVFVQWSNAANGAANAKSPELSRGTAVILLFVYGCYLTFQLKTHISIYNDRGQKSEKKTTKKDAPNALERIGLGTAEVAGGEAPNNIKGADPDDEEEEPQLSFIGALLALCIATALIGLCSEYVVDSIGYVTEVQHVPQEFVGLILLPIVGNAAEHATAVTVAIKDKMDLAIGVAVGSSMQIALLVLPLTVVIGWIVESTEDNYNSMTLNFDGFVIAVLFVAVLLVNYLITDGKSHWLEGIMLMTTYIIIAVAAWFYPQDQPLAG